MSWLLCIAWVPTMVIWASSQPSVLYCQHRVCVMWDDTGSSPSLTDTFYHCHLPWTVGVSSLNLSVSRLHRSMAYGKRQSIIKKEFFVLLYIKNINFIIGRTKVLKYISWIRVKNVRKGWWTIICICIFMENIRGVNNIVYKNRRKRLYNANALVINCMLIHSFAFV